jgi:Glycosyltransferase family 87
MKSFPVFPFLVALWITVVGLLLPQLALHFLQGAYVAYRDHQHHGDFDAELLALPIHVLTFETVNDTAAVMLMLAAPILIGVSGWIVFTRTREKLSFGTLVTLQALAGIFLALAPVTFTQDPTCYVVYARLYGLFGINPYHLPPHLPHDATLHLLAPVWGTPFPNNVYGPLWTILVSSIARFQADASPVAQWITQRFIAVIASIMATWGIYRMLRRSFDPRDALARVANFAFHPLVLLETGIDGHNDMVMVACGVWAFALLEEQPLIAGMLFGASVAVKFTVVIIAPFFIAMIWRAYAQRFRSAALALLGMSGTFTASMAPFWFGFRTLASIPQTQNDVTASPVAFLAHRYMAAAGIAETDEVFPGQRHWHLFRHTTISQFMDMGLVVLWMVLACVLWYRFIHTRERSNIYLTAVGFFAAIPALGPYYLVWLSPILAERSRWGRYVWWLLAAALVYYVQSLMGHLSWNQTSDIYTLTLILVPLAAILYYRRANTTEGPFSHKEH